MADNFTKLQDSATYTAAGTFYTTGTNTGDMRDLVFTLMSQAPGGVGGDTLDVTIQESDESDFANSWRIRDVLSFTQIIGTHTTDAQLKHAEDSPKKNVNRWIRAKIVIAGDATKYSQKFLIGIYHNDKV